MENEKSEAKISQNGQAKPFKAFNNQAELDNFFEKSRGKYES